MVAMGRSNTSEMNSLDLEVHAAALGLVEELPDPLGSFDDGFRAVHRLDVPMFDDPRRGDSVQAHCSHPYVKAAIASGKCRSRRADETASKRQAVAGGRALSTDARCGAAGSIPLNLSA